MAKQLVTVQTSTHSSVSAVGFAQTVTACVLCVSIMQCNRYDSQRTFLEQITSGQETVALIGCGCSLATEPVAEISRFWNITHVSVRSQWDTIVELFRFLLIHSR